MALASREDGQVLAVNSIMNLFSRADVSRLDTDIIGISIQHAEHSGELSEDALHAINESKDVLLKHSTGQISTYDANEKLKSLASTIRANRGIIRAIVGDTVGTLTTMKAGLGGIATAGGLYWSWTNFIFALSNLQRLAMTPAGALAAAGAVNNIRVLLPEGGFSWIDYLKLSMNPEIIASLIPDMTQLEQQLAEAGKLITQQVPEGLFGSILNAGGNVLSSLGGAVNKALGGTLSGASAIAQEEIRHTHTQMANYAKQASGSLQTVQNMFGGWIMVFVIVLIMWAFIHLYRRRSNSAFRENVSEFLIRRQGGFRFKSSKSSKSPRNSKKSKKNNKKSAKKVKRSAKKSAKNKRSTKRSAKNKRSAKKSANKK